MKAAGQAYFPDPYTVKVPFLSGTPTGPGFAPRALRNPRPPTLDQVAAASYRIEEYGPDGATVERRIDLLRGKKIFMQEDTLGNGTFNHKVWYENGQPVRGSGTRTGPGGFPSRKRGATGSSPESPLTRAAPEKPTTGNATCRAR